MTDQELAHLADLIAARLVSHVIPAALPAYIGDMLRDGLQGDTLAWNHYIPLAGANGINVIYVLSPDASIHIEMKDTYGARFWEGTLVAAPAVTPEPTERQAP